MFNFLLQVVLGLFDRIVAVCHGRNIDLRGFNPSWANPITNGEEDNWLVTPRWWRYCTSITVLVVADHYDILHSKPWAQKELWVRIPIRSFEEWGVSQDAYGVVELPDGSLYEVSQHRLWSRDRHGLPI